jgi:hypothetical protein
MNALRRLPEVLKVAWILLIVSCSLSPNMRGTASSVPVTPTLAPTPQPTKEEIALLPEYRLILSLDAADRRLVGRQQVIFPNHTGQSLQEIVFRLYPNLPQYGGQLHVAEARVDDQPVPFSLRADDTALALSLPQPLAAESSAVLSLDFDLLIPRKETGYVLFGISQSVWSLPDAYPLLAVHDASLGRTGAGATWHEDVAPPHADAVFAEAAYYDVTLTLPSTLTLATTGSVVGETSGSEGQRVYRIVGGPLREFAWLASAGYSVLEATVHDTRVRSYYLPDDAASAQTALDFAVASLRVYEDAFGPYPWDEMIVVEAPLLFYGMEFPGMNLIGLDLYREQRTQLEDRVVHEVAHQWWYAQVGNDQVNTPWLDEALAEYSMAIYYRQVYGDARADTLVNQRWRVPYQLAVENGYDAVVNQPSAAFGWEYELIVYEKAALFFDALHQRLGQDAFMAVLRAYVEHYRWRIATPDGFLRLAESVSGEDLDDLYSQWILGRD